MEEEKIKFKLSLDLSLECFDSACKSSSLTSRNVRSISNFKASFSHYKTVARASKMMEKDT
jgi:hypothetical protein